MVLVHGGGGVDGAVGGYAEDAGPGGAGLVGSGLPASYQVTEGIFGAPLLVPVLGRCR